MTGFLCSLFAVNMNLDNKCSHILDTDACCDEFMSDSDILSIGMYYLMDFKSMNECKLGNYVIRSANVRIFF